MNDDQRSISRLHALRWRVRDAIVPPSDGDRGDVPGWVLITLMTAGLVVVIWTLAGPALADLFQHAISRVSGL